MTEIELLTHDGDTLVETASYPKGHPNPMTDDDVKLKFMALCEPLIGLAQQEALLGALWDIDDARDVDGLLDLVQIKQ